MKTAISLAILGLAASIVLSAGEPTPAGGKEATGQHRGYTNDRLFLRLDDGKEMTFLVKIPGDKDWKWHKDFETLSRITVTYHAESGQDLPVATAIRAAAAK
ncbi:MAG TPA: hypothetical protein VKE50_05585 [Thermoanaerobaculia bacterium]|nr:hypothetical protein [Thermoanaerobaculia bacterium]